MAQITIGGGSPVDMAAVRNTIRMEMAAMPVIGVGQVLFGVKLTIDIICTLAGIYNRHRANVISQLPATVVGALDVLTAACEELQAINPPGPR